MASLKALRGRINSVKSTRKITSAMKLVAASKLKRAQTQAEAARPYAERKQRMLAALAVSAAGSPDAPQMLVGTGRDQVHLLVVVTADRGLAGAFNTNVGRAARTAIQEREAAGKTVKVITVGRKGRDYLRREYASRLVGEFSFAGKKRVEFSDVDEVAARIAAMLTAGEFDVCTIIYNRFVSVISQNPDRGPDDPVAAAGSDEGRHHWPAGAVRVRAGRGVDPCRTAAAQHGDPAFPRLDRERGR